MFICITHPCVKSGTKGYAICVFEINEQRLVLLFVDLLFVVCRGKRVRVVLFMTHWAPTSAWETTRWSDHSNIPSKSKCFNECLRMIQSITILLVIFYLFSSLFSCFFQWRQLHIDTRRVKGWGISFVCVVFAAFVAWPETTKYIIIFSQYILIIWTIQYTGIMYKEIQ